MASALQKSSSDVLDNSLDTADIKQEDEIVMRRSSNQASCLEHSTSPISFGHAAMPIIPSSPNGQITEDLELQPIGLNATTETPTYIPALPPVDRGSKALLFLAGSVAIEMMVWGMPYTIGILLNHWTTTLFPEGNVGTLTLAGTLQSGLLYFAFAVIGPLYAMMPHRQRWIQGAGLVISSVGIVASGFVTQPWHLIVTTGLLYCSACAIYIPVPSLLFEWFAQRRGLAGGILWSGTGLGGALLPFLVNYLLKTYPYHIAMTITGTIFFCVNAVAMIPIQWRVPLTIRRSEEPRRAGRIDWNFFRKRAMWIGAVYVFASGLGTYMPTLWIPTFVQELGGSRLDGTALIAIMSAASVLGQTAVGYLADHFSLRKVVISDCLFAAISIFIFWGFATSTAVLALFAVTWGLSGLGAAACWTKIISDASGDDVEKSGIIFSIYATLKGVGNIAAGPISDSILRVGSLPNTNFAYGFKNYGGLILYTGICWLASAATGMLFK